MTLKTIKSKWREITILSLCSILFIYLFLKQTRNVEGLSDDIIMSYTDELLGMTSCEDIENIDEEKLTKELKDKIKQETKKFIHEMYEIKSIYYNGNSDYDKISELYQYLLDIYAANMGLISTVIDIKKMYIKSFCKNNSSYTFQFDKFKTFLMKEYKNPTISQMGMLDLIITFRLMNKLNINNLIDKNKTIFDKYGNKFSKTIIAKRIKMRKIDKYVNNIEKNIKITSLNEYKNKKQNITRDINNYIKKFTGKDDYNSYNQKWRIKNLLKDYENTSLILKTLDPNMDFSADLSGKNEIFTESADYVQEDTKSYKATSPPTTTKGMTDLGKNLKSVSDTNPQGLLM